jgi:hypothetical protein
VNIHGFDWRLGGRIVRKCVVNGTKKKFVYLEEEA